MTLKDLVRVLPAYAMVHVHDQDHTFAHKGNPHQFTTGLYQNLWDSIVILAVPLDSYAMEVTVVEVRK